MAIAVETSPNNPAPEHEPGQTEEIDTIFAVEHQLLFAKVSNGQGEEILVLTPGLHQDRPDGKHEHQMPVIKFRPATEEIQSVEQAREIQAMEQKDTYPLPFLSVIGVRVSAEVDWTPASQVLAIRRTQTASDYEKRVVRLEEDSLTMAVRRFKVE